MKIQEINHRMRNEKLASARADAIFFPNGWDDSSLRWMKEEREREREMLC